MLGHVRGRDDLLKLKHLNSSQVIKAVNVVKIVVFPESNINNLQDVEIDFNGHTENNRTENQVNSDISKVAFHFGKYLLTEKKTIALLHQKHASMFTA